MRAGRVRAAEAPLVDALDRTSAFLAGRSEAAGPLETGGSQPTMEAHRFTLEVSSDQLVASSPDAVRAASFAEACRKPNGGFAMTLHAPESQLDATYYALRITELRRDRAYLRHIAIDAHRYLIGAVDLDVAGYDIDELYYAVSGLAILGLPVPEPTLEAVQTFIEACACEDGGYSRFAGEEAPHIERTYCAAGMLRKLGLPQPSRPLHRDWTRRCLRDGRIFESPLHQNTSPAHNYWGLGAARLLGAEIQPSKLVGGLLEDQNADGGFGEPSSTIWQTFCAVRILKHAARGDCDGG